MEALPVEERHKALLRLCVKLTEHAYRVTDEDIETVKEAGLSEEELLEGVWVACQFNAVDRLADSLGLQELLQLDETAQGSGT